MKGTSSCRRKTDNKAISSFHDLNPRIRSKCVETYSIEDVQGEGGIQARDRGTSRARRRLFHAPSILGKTPSQGGMAVNV